MAMIKVVTFLIEAGANTNNQDINVCVYVCVCACMCVEFGYTPLWLF